MKTVTIFILAIALRGSVYSQTASVKTDKISFLEIVLADSLKKEVLYENAVQWFANQKGPELNLNDSLNGKLSGQSYFLVYSQTGILKKLSGKITYNFYIEVKDGKYRYLFNEYVFHYYKEDRYYNIVETGKTKPLEDDKAPGWQKLWIKHRATVNKKMVNDIQDFKLRMIHNGEDQKIKEKEVDW